MLLYHNCNLTVVPLLSSQCSVGHRDRSADDYIRWSHRWCHESLSGTWHQAVCVWSLWCLGQALGHQRRNVPTDLHWPWVRHQRHLCTDTHTHTHAHVLHVICQSFDAKILEIQVRSRFKYIYSVVSKQEIRMQLFRSRDGCHYSDTALECYTLRAVRRYCNSTCKMLTTQKLIVVHTR